jgi:hypothetical protein
MRGGEVGPPRRRSWCVRSRDCTVLRGNYCLILGVEKTGVFVTHFEEIDQTETPGQLLFPQRSYLLLTDRYIKERVVQSDSDKRYGLDTYFGRKFFYKTRG